VDKLAPRWRSGALAAALAVTLASHATPARAEPNVPADCDEAVRRDCLQVYVYGQPSPEATYAARNQVTALREESPVDSVPQAITVLPRQLLTDTAARRADEVLPMAPGVVWGAGFGGLWDDYFVRGSRVWAGTLYRNGFVAGYAGPASIDAEQIDRIEVLRGPTAVLYGPGVPGGTINLITKEPLWTQQTQASASWGSFATRRATADVTGPLVARRAAYRFTGAYETSDGPRGNDDSERLILDPSVLLDLGKATLLLESQSFLTHYRPDPIGVPVLDGDPWALSTRRSYVPRSGALSTFGGTLWRTELRYRLGEQSSLLLGVQRQVGYLSEPAPYPLGLQDDGHTLALVATQMNTHAEDLAVQVGVNTSFQALGLRHELGSGLDARTETVDWSMAAATPEVPWSLDLLAPQAATPAPEVGPPTSLNRWQYRLAGWWLEDRLHLTERWTLVGAGRVDAYEQRSVVRPSVREHRGELAPSWKLGAVWAPIAPVTLYSSLSHGYWPVVGVSGDGSLLAPERNYGGELGARLTDAARRFTVDEAGFVILNHNVTVPDPNNANFQTQRGATLTRGVESFVTARLDRSLRAVGSYTYTVATITDDVTPERRGTALDQVPRHAASLWLFGEVRGGPLRGFSLGLGERAVSQRPLADGTRLPAAALSDAVLGYQMSKLRLQCRIDNLFDAQWFRGGSGALGVQPGTPRAFLVTARLQ